jgi:hypothetical protein
VLNIHEERSTIGRFRNTGYLCPKRSYQETPKFCITQGGSQKSFLCARLLYPIDDHLIFDGDFSTVTNLTRNGGEHHAVCLIRKGTIIRLNPANSSCFAEPQPVW